MLALSPTVILGMCNLVVLVNGPVNSGTEAPQRHQSGRCLCGCGLVDDRGLRHDLSHIEAAGLVSDPGNGPPVDWLPFGVDLVLGL